MNPTSGRTAWWSRRNNALLDLKAVGDHLEQRATQPYFRTK